MLMYNGCGMGWMASMMIVSWLVGVSLVALLVVGIIAAVRRLWRSPSVGAPDDRALEILRERYARGEIGKEEFDTRRRDLSTR
jgi:putative membrane protein